MGSAIPDAQEARGRDWTSSLEGKATTGQISEKRSALALKALFYPSREPEADPWARVGLGQRCCWEEDVEHSFNPDSGAAKAWELPRED